MKILFICMFFGVVTLNACAQIKCNIKKAYAFYTVSMPGMAMADEHGNTIPPKPNISRFIYIEWCGVNNPKIEAVLYNNKLLTTSLTKVVGSSVTPGGDIGNNSNFKIATKKSNSIWKLELQPMGTDQMPAINCKNILIKIKGVDKSCQIKLIKENELASLPNY